MNYIYLNIFRKEGVPGNEKLSNYAFKYITADEENEFFDYKPISPVINCSEYHIQTAEGPDTIECIFNQLHQDNDEREITVTYFLKVVENSSYIYGEDLSTIAVTESPSTIIYKRDPATGAGGDYDKISIKVEGTFPNWCGINIIAQIQQNNIIEYSAYNAIMKIRPDPNKKEKSGDEEEEETDNTVLFAVIGGVLGAIIIGLIIVIVYFQIKNKNLMNQVKHVSFQKTNANVDPNLLLQKNTESIN